MSNKKNKKNVNTLLRMRTNRDVVYFLPTQEDQAFALRRNEIRMKGAQIYYITVTGLSDEEISMLADGVIKPRPIAA